MKQFICVLGVIVVCATLCAGGTQAQEASHVQIGVFADYLRTSQTDTNSAGVGGRLAFPIFHRIKLEGEVSYDFDQEFTEGFTNNGTGSVSFQRTNMRVLQGLFGPKLELGHGWFHPFVELKGGFVNYQLSGGACHTLGLPEFGGEPATSEYKRGAVSGRRRAGAYRSRGAAAGRGR